MAKRSKSNVKRAMGFRPSNAHGPNAVLGTVHSRNAGNQNSLALAGIQMSPLALFPMIATREILLAFRAAESYPPRRIDLDSNFLILHVEFDVTDRPWRGQVKNVRVEFFVLHWGFLTPKILPLPTQMPDGTNLAPLDYLVCLRLFGR
jgi:hypothetical protein